MISFFFNRIFGPVNPAYLTADGVKRLPRKIFENSKLRIAFLIGFKNSAGILSNFKYRIYHKFCTYQFKSQSPNQFFSLNKEYYSHFLQNCFLKLDFSKDILPKIDDLSNKIETELSSPENKMPKYDFMSRYFFKKEEIKSILPILEGQIDQALKSVLKSNYLISSVYAYRQVTGTPQERSTWLWHSDEHPDCHIKVFIFLNDVSPETGATRLFPWEYSKLIKKAGFLDRRNLTPKVKKLLDNSSKVTYAQGEKGTVFLFNANTIHKASMPISGYRDLLTIEVLPSPFSNIKYAEHDLAFWEPPLKLMFNDTKDIL